MIDYLLTERFLAPYKKINIEDKEQWWKVVHRNVEGIFSLMRKYAPKHRMSIRRQMYNAQQMFDDMFYIRFLPVDKLLKNVGTPLADERDGLNACMEIGFEHMNIWYLVKLNPINFNENYHRTLYSAVLYAKIINCVPIQWEKVNQVIEKNKNIVIKFVGWYPIKQLDLWHEYIIKSDRQISAYLVVDPSDNIVLDHTGIP